MTNHDNNCYGYCPICGDKGLARERRIYGNDTCINGHTYPTKEAIHNTEYAEFENLRQKIDWDKQGMPIHLYLKDGRKAWMGSQTIVWVKK